LVRIITDSVSDLSDNQILQYGIDAVLRLKISFGDKTYTDGIDLSKQDFYKILAAGTVLPKTSQITPAEFLDVFDSFPDDEIVVISMSGALSGTYQSAVIAKETSKRKDIWVVDSRNVTCGLALLVVEAAKMRQNGKSAGEIYEELEALKEKVVLFAVLETLKYLRMGGRLSAASAVVGTLLNIKPIISVKNGEVLAIGKEKGMKKAYEFILKKINEQPLDPTKTVVFAGANCPDKISEYAKTVAPVIGTDSHITVDIGATVGVHIGEGGHGLAYISKSL